MSEQPTEQEITDLSADLTKTAALGGYHINDDNAFTRDLICGLLINQKRYGYMSCPCRLASGQKEEDIDIICPCDYRDADLDEFNSCYCSLYVSDKAIKNHLQLSSIPERRLPKDKRDQQETKAATSHKQKYPVWRCRVCGYLCARDHAPEQCPICKAPRERFEIFT